ncbi:MAG TPA: VPLPA-CTERM sorting domain-containing protein, partial [Phycisphaerales bacterium]|nr:VPLPA-CTERM sorting domain-containing protein [Phycisphaerales bacterium]
TLYIDMTGWETYTGFAAPGGLNSETIVTLGAGTEIVNIEFVGIQLQMFNGSWASEFTVSVNDGLSFDNFWDSTIPGAPNNGNPFGPVSANFDNPGLFGSGPFTMVNDDLWICVYETWNDAGNAIDARVIAGGILITYNPIPAPGALALLGVAGLVGVRRRRA